MIAFETPNLVSYYTENEIFPFGRTISGDKDTQKPIYNENEKLNELPILIVDEDVVNSEGYGLKKGFYEINLSKDLDFLLLFQTGNLKAKIPVIKIEQIDKNPKPKEKISEKKKKKKYKLGKSPDDFVYKNAELRYDKKTQLYVLFYEYKNTRAIGIIKIK